MANISLSASKKPYRLISNFYINQGLRAPKQLCSESVMMNHSTEHEWTILEPLENAIRN